MRKTMDLRELSEKACEVAMGSDFTIYKVMGLYFIDAGGVKPLKFDTAAELSEYLEGFAD